jgi:coronin-1B/1C/6
VFLGQKKLTMSGRFVRASSFRHVFGQPAKPEDTFQGANVQCAGDGEFLTSNGKFIAYACRGGGGPVNILMNSKPARLGKQPKLEVHRAKVLDFEFNPFDQHMLATCSEDNMVKISRIPEDGLTADLKDALVTLAGHDKKVIGLRWHPTASNVLATAGFDHKLKVFDVEASAVVLEYNDQHNEALNHVRWNRNGSLMGTTCKDKVVRIFDPRDQKVAQEVLAFAGSKKASVEFMDNHNMIAVTGFTKTSMRQIKLYDVRNLSTEAHVEDVDQSAGVMIPFYDHDTSVLFVGGKGDSTIKYFEVTGDSTPLHFLSAFSDVKSHKGFSFIPKAECDTTKCEIAHCLRIVGDNIVPVSFQVPRKAADQFQSDLYPDAYAGIPSGTCAEYLEGNNAEPTLTSMRPGERLSAEVQEFVAKKTYAELEAELAAAYARIAELEAAQ